MENKNYRIELVEGDFFSEGQQSSQHFYETLFDNFSLLSWLNQTAGIRILDEQDYQLDDKLYKVYSFSSQTDAISRYLVEMEKNKITKAIEYCMLKNFEVKTYKRCLKEVNSTIKVIFGMHKETSKLKRAQNDKENNTGRNTIFIDIIDYKGSLNNIGQVSKDRRVNLKKNYLKPNQIQYFYKEPLSKRSKQIPNCHFSLAFQGGGAKSVSYTGVFKALKELHGNTPITSIIGSSAGGLLGLAIGTEMKPEAMSELSLRMDTVPKDKLFKSQGDITPKKQKQFDSYIHKIKCLLHNYGLLENSMFDQIIESFSDLETSEKILNVLELINPSVAELFSLKLKKPVSKGNWFGDEQFYTKRLNYYGLIEGGIMNGKAFCNLANMMIRDFFVKHFNTNYQKKHPEDQARKEKIMKLLTEWGVDTCKSEAQIEEELQQEQNMERVTNLTLKRFYEITGVEFTCTSVDLDDQVLRFFNQKTTPNLPVCKAIQMSGAFPVAFKAQKWQKQYGKYYIHYSNTRREIDLTGHTFTDGGLLANFPIKYIDNEQMRPMYFSHTKNPKNTILYGFGLEEIPDKIDEEHQKLKEEAIADLKQHLSSKLSKFTLIKNLIFSDSKSQLEKTMLSEVPLFNFLQKLLSTLPVSDYNLNIQCFRESIILTEVGARNIQPKRNVSKEIKKFRKFKECIEHLYQCSQGKVNIDPRELLRSTCERVRGVIYEYDTPVNELIESIRSKVINSLYNFQGTRILNQMKQCQKLNQILRKLEYIYTPEIFKMQETTSVKQNLFKIVNEIQEYFFNMSSTEYEDTKKVVSRMIEQQLLIIDKTTKRINEIIKDLQSQGQTVIDSDEYLNLSYLSTDFIFDLASIQSKFFIIDQPYVTQIFKQINSLSIARIKIEYEIVNQRSSIQYQLRSMIKNINKKKIHLVLESKQNSHLYYSSMFEIFQNILHEEQNQDKKIEMITTSDIHSVFAFLLAGGKKISNIRKQMWKAKNLVTFQTGIVEEFQTYNWARTESREMQELLELAWTNQYHIFEQMQKYLIDQGQKNLLEEIEVMRNEFLYSKNHVTNSMSKILDHVVKSSYQVMKIKDDPKLQKKRLAQLLSLKNGSKGKDYKEKNKKISENTKRLIKMMMVHFQELLVQVIFNKTLVKDTFQLGVDEKTAEKVWKGIIVQKLLSSKKLQFYIKEKLEEMKLNPNTTLEQYYEYCQRKITINFSLINKNKQRMEVINRFTRPNMPVWAAIVASTSMPYLFPDFSFQQEWEINPFADSKMRKLMHYFFNSTKERTQEYYISGNFVSTLPLELLTNPKIAGSCFIDLQQKQKQYQKTQALYQNTKDSSYASKMIHTKGTQSQVQNQYAVITFAFKKVVPERKIVAQKQFSKKFFDFSNILNLGIDAMMGKFKNIEVGLKGIMNRLEIFKYLSVGLECHDNTIMKLYFEQTIKLPISLGTLDFYKIESGRNELIHSYIYQSQFVVRGIFENLCISEDQTDFYYLAKKSTYIQYQINQEHIRLQFISKSKWNRKLATMYKIFWKVNESDKYIPYDEKEIIVPASIDQMFIKFDYPDLVEVNRKTHEMILNFEKIKHLEEVVFFKFNYEDLDKRYLLPVPLISQRLKTRVIPNSKALITEPKIEDSAITLYVQPKMIKLKCRAKKKQVSIGPNGLRSSDIQQTVYQSSADPKSQSEKHHSPGLAYLLIKTKVVFKNDGLHCKGCVHPLQRAHNQLATVGDGKSEQFELGECSKCLKKNCIIGYKCLNQKCVSRAVNQYCFPCLFVYSIANENGTYFCTTKKHKMDFFSSSTVCTKDIVLCHFCSTAATSYYNDRECNINMCLKCSLILQTRSAI